MPLSMADVRAVLDPEEPDYEAAAALGPEALPHLEALVRGSEPMLASKAAYAASVIGGAQAAETVLEAARSDDASVRVAAAAAAANLEASQASNVLETLVGDSDPGVRKVARTSVPAEASERLTRRMEANPERSPDIVGSREPLDPDTVQGLMPGEEPPGQTMPGESDGLMPGESDDGMPR